MFNSVVVLEVGLVPSLITVVVPVVVRSIVGAFFQLRPLKLRSVSSRECLTVGDGRNDHLLALVVMGFCGFFVLFNGQGWLYSPCYPCHLEGLKSHANVFDGGWDIVK